MEKKLMEAATANGFSLIRAGEGTYERYVFYKNRIETIDVERLRTGLRSLGRIKRVAQLFTGRRDALGDRVFLMDREFIETSKDVYALDFLGYMSRNELLSGTENPFALLNVEKKDLRHQCEYELRGLLMKLRTFHVVSDGGASEVRLVMQHALSVVARVLRALVLLELDHDVKTLQVSECLELLRGKFKAPLQVLDRAFSDEHAVDASQFNAFREDLRLLIAHIDEVTAGGGPSV